MYSRSEINSSRIFPACIGFVPGGGGEYAVVKLLCVVNLQSHSNLLSRRTLRRQHVSLVYAQLSAQKRVRNVVHTGGVTKTLRRSNSLSCSVFSTAGSFE